MEGKNYLQAAALVNRISIQTGIDRLSIQQALARLMKTRWLTGVSANGSPLGQIKIIGDIPQKEIDPVCEAWQSALTSEGFNAENIATLTPCYKKLDGLSNTDLRNLANGLRTLKDNQLKHIGQPLYLVSAQYLLGSSKILSELPAKSLTNFGVNLSNFTKQLLYVVVGGSSTPQNVVLIENPSSFELAIKTKAAAYCAFISTFGFGLSNGNSEHGNQLASIVESGFSQAITLTREDCAPISAKVLLSHQNITFWGDLDTAGIQIYLRLKARIPNLKLSALYRPMIDALGSAYYSHPYIALTKKNGQSGLLNSYKSTEPEINKLLDLVSTRGIDQEFVGPDLIEEFAGGVL
jgi:hypothetical protein